MLGSEEIDANEKDAATRGCNPELNFREFGKEKGDEGAHADQGKRTLKAQRKPARKAAQGSHGWAHTSVDVKINTTGFGHSRCQFRLAEQRRDRQKTRQQVGEAHGWSSKAKGNAG